MHIWKHKSIYLNIYIYIFINTSEHSVQYIAIFQWCKQKKISFPTNTTTTASHGIPFFEPTSHQAFRPISMALVRSASPDEICQSLLDREGTCPLWKQDVLEHLK